MPQPYHLAPSLAVLRSEINRLWPNRDRRSDGWIGDAAHSARVSDHNPNERGSVNALDIDEDGPDMARLVTALIGDPRVNYVIYERTIYSRSRLWIPRPYYGSNPHDKHLHVSIRQTLAAEQDTRPWGLFKTPSALAPTQPTTPEGSPNMSDTLATKILDELTHKNHGLAYLAAQNYDIATKDHQQFVELKAQITDLTLKVRGDLDDVKTSLAAVTNEFLAQVERLTSEGRLTPDVEAELVAAVSAALDGATLALKARA